MTTELSTDDREQLQRFEESLLRPQTRFDRDHLERFLAEDFLEFGKSGRIYRRGDILASPAQPLGAVFPLPNFSVRLLSEDVGQVTYDSQVTQNGITERARRSSIWTRSPGGWVLRFHQGTPFPEDF